MKKILSSVLVFVVSLSLAGVAMAAAPKPPVSICLNPGWGYVYALVVKPMGNIKMLDGVEKFYSIQGALITGSTPPNIPQVGSGYMEGNVFHFNLNATWHSGSTPYYIQAEGFWDVIAKTGTMYSVWSNSGNWVFSLSEVSCTNTDTMTLSSQGMLNEASPLEVPNQ